MTAQKLTLKSLEVQLESRSLLCQERTSVKQKGGPGGLTHWLSYKTGKAGGRPNDEKKRKQSEKR